MKPFPHFLHDYDTPTRSCYAVDDGFGNLRPCNRSTFWILYPDIQINTVWS